MKELTLLEKKVIILLTYEISNTFHPIFKNNLTDIINNIKLKKYTKRQIEMVWHDTLDKYELADTRIEDSEDLREMDRLLIENFGEGEGLAPEKWKMNRKIRTILKRGIRDAEEARMVDDYICQTTDEDEIKRAENRTSGIRGKNQGSVTKRPYLLEKRIFFFVEIQNRIKR